MIGTALAISATYGFWREGKMNLMVTGFIVLLAALMVVVPHLTALLSPKKFSSEELEKLNAMVKKDRLKLIERLGWHWEVCGDSLCRLDNKTGEAVERIERHLLTEVLGVNTDMGPFVEDFWLVAVCGSKEYSIGSELCTPDIWDWFFALEGFDHDAYIECMRCTDNRKPMLWQARKVWDSCGC